MIITRKIFFLLLDLVGCKYAWLLAKESILGMFFSLVGSAVFSVIFSSTFGGWAGETGCSWTWLVGSTSFSEV